MTCKEAEQMVMPYINKELTDKELSAFLSHIHLLYYLHRPCPVGRWRGRSEYPPAFGGILKSIGASDPGEKIF